MNDKRVIAGLAGFAFVAAWIGFSFGGAVLCLLGATVFWVLAGVVEGKVDLGELQDRLSGEDKAPTASSPPPRPSTPARVQ